MEVKFTFPAISDDLSFAVSQGSMPPDPLADLHLGTRGILALSSCKIFCCFMKCFTHQAVWSISLFRDLSSINPFPLL